MKKKNIIILLLIPFLIAILGIVTINATYTMMDPDITAIEWEYGDVTPYKISNTLYELKASGVNKGNFKVSDGNDLVWSVTNKDANDTNEYAKIINENDKYYLQALQVGEVTVTCSNVKGNISRQMTGLIYDTGVILIKPIIESSQSNIDSKIYYGEYDWEGSNKINANIAFNISTIPHDIESQLVVSHSDNIDVDLSDEIVTINSDGPAYFTLKSNDPNILDATYNFEVIKDGVNVYTYEDLLKCTNYSNQGEVVVLRKSFESVDNAYLKDEEGNFILTDGKLTLKSNNVECFGNYNHQKKTYSFAGEIREFKTTFNTSYIEQWNEFVKTNDNYSKISDRFKVGLYVQKDFYGNGYMLNLHNLTYPYSSEKITDENGNIYYEPKLRSDNLFRGPLPLYTLGDPNGFPLVQAQGQDNIGMYVKGNNIVINDVNMQNCEFDNIISHLDYVGTVIEIAGNNNVIKNSKFSNGRQVLRSFSSHNLLVKNSMLSCARNFLFTTGSNEYLKIDGNKEFEFKNLDGTIAKTTIDDYLSKGGIGDKYLSTYLTKAISSNDRYAMQNSLLSIQDALNNHSDIENDFKGSTIIEDCFFYKSGLSSIALETSFNGPFLYNSAPSYIEEKFAQVSGGSKSLIPLFAQNTSGVSYPVELTIRGDTRFYDYKTADKIDIAGLMKENITLTLKNLGYQGDISIDDIFPIKEYMIQRAAARNEAYYDSASGKTYYNIPIAFYGGGLNLSKVNYAGITNEGEFGSATSINLLDSYLRRSDSGYASILLKTVTVVTGFEPFKFVLAKNNGAYFNQAPVILDLQNNVKGE